MHRIGLNAALLLTLIGTLPALAGGVPPGAPVPQAPAPRLISLSVATRLPIVFDADQRFFPVELPLPPRAPEGTLPRIVFVPEDLSGLTAEVEATTRQIEAFCEEYRLPCESAPAMRVHVSAQPPFWNGIPHSGLIDAGEGKIWIYRLAPEGVGRPLFHELVHWVHFAAPHRRAQDAHGLDPWIQEAIPHLASILFRSDSTLGTAETLYLQTRLSGTIRLRRIEDSTPEWFGLVGLWTRYLGHLYRDPRALLGQWLELDPGQEPRFDLDFHGEASRPAPAWAKRIENLFSWFAVALHANLKRGELDPWGLYSLGLPFAGTVTPTSDGRVQRLRAGECVVLQPLEFRYVWARALSEAPLIEQSPGIRAVLWTGRRKPDLLGSSAQGLSFFAWDRVAVVNGGGGVGRFCVSAAE